MKKIAILICLTFPFLFACEEEVSTPSADFHIEVSDPELGTVVLNEPYQVDVNQLLTIVGDNDAEFNTFWPGDTLFKGNDTILQTYVEEPMINHQGIDLGEGQTKTYTYLQAGDYEITFIAINVGDLGQELKKEIIKKSIKVSAAE